MEKLNKNQRVKLMGKIALVTHKYELNPDRSNKKWEIVEIPQRAGWITGFSYILDGGMESDYDDYGYSHTYFVEEKRHKVIKVRFWTNQKEINVPYTGIIYPTIETPYCHDEFYKKECREVYQSQIKYFPRDEKGRFK